MLFSLGKCVGELWQECTIHLQIQGGDPPNGRGPMIFYAQNANSSLAIHFKHHFNRNMQKTTPKMTFYFNR